MVALDFDGVVLESIEVKTDAFRTLFADAPCVDAIVEHHLRNMGVSRYAKFRHIYASLLKRPLNEEGMARLDRAFGTLVRERMLACPMVPGAREFLEAAMGRLPVVVVSATPEPELRDIVVARGLERCFAGVFGAPATKVDALEKLLSERQLDPSEIVFVGDAESDRDAAAAVGVRFIHRWRAGTPRLVDVEADALADLWPLIDRCGLQAEV